MMCNYQILSAWHNLATPEFQQSELVTLLITLPAHVKCPYFMAADTSCLVEKKEISNLIKECLIQSHQLMRAYFLQDDVFPSSETQNIIYLCQY